MRFLGSAFLTKNGFMKNFFSGKTCSPSYWFLVFIFALSSCKSSDIDKVKPNTNLEIGVETIVATQTIPSSGGTVEVNAAASEIDGLEIVVPANSYSDSRTFNISTAPITSYTLGQYFKPLTPLIQIENGGGYANGIMEITIPVAVPSGDIPLGFYYNEIDGTLEAIPVKNYTSTSITLLTRHFMPASDLSPSESNLKSGGIKIDATSNLVISSITESILKGKTIISSGYKVGTDDWEFPNYGSYIATGGQCAGQNMCAMWYYFEKKLKGDGNLFGKFSTVPSLWQDNAIGYRFCSVIHNDLSWEGTFIDFFDKYIDKNQDMDKLKLYSIAGAMLTTGEPQGIGIYRQTGAKADGTPIYGGHDLICYQVAVNEGKLYISDPNKPGVEQSINFKNNKFEPYIAQLNGHAASNPYPFVTWYAKTAYIEWDKIGKRYAELLDSTIGNKAPNIFPPYTIWVKGKADSQLKDGFTTDNDTLRCMVECPTTARGFNVGGKWYIWYEMYDKNGNKIDVSEGSGKGYSILKPGLNKIGIYIYSKKTGVVDVNGNLIDLFIDFKWFNVYYSSLKISPNPITGAPDDEITITASTGGMPPKNAKYVWNFGDGSAEVTVENDSIVKHTFSKEGNFDVVLKLYDNSANKLVGQATATANIVNGILSTLHACKTVMITFYADIIDNEGNFMGGASIRNDELNSPNYYPLVWNGASFSVTFDHSNADITKKGSITGTMSDDGYIVKTLTAHYNYVDYLNNIVTDLTVTNVPYDVQQGYSYVYNPVYKIEGPSVGQYISSYSQSSSRNYSGNVITIYSNSINYNNPDINPSLIVGFDKNLNQ